MYRAKRVTFFLTALFTFYGLSLCGYAEEIPQSVRDMVPQLESWGQNAVLVAAVKAQNSKDISLDDIKNQDTTWRETTGVNVFMQSLLDNDAAKELRKLEASAPYFLEMFLMDNQGANVAMTNKTSDYWQGDEPKFTESFNDGAGAVHFGPVEFDESAQAYLVQISVPIKDGDQTIGALTIGINLDEVP